MVTNQEIINQEFRKRQAEKEQDFYTSFGVLKRQIKNQKLTKITGLVFNEKNEKWEKFPIKKINIILNTKKQLLFKSWFEIIYTAKSIYLKNDDIEIKFENGGE